MHTCSFPAYCERLEAVFHKVFSALDQSNALFFSFMKDSWIRRQNHDLKAGEMPSKRAMRIRIALLLHVEKTLPGRDRSIGANRTRHGPIGMIAMEQFFGQPR